MLRIKATFVVLSALFCLSHGQDPTEYTDVTSSMTSFEAQYKYTPTIVTIRNEIYTVFLKKHYLPLFREEYVELLVTSLASGNRRQQIRSCSLSVPLDSMTGVEIDKVVSLGNGKIVIASNRQRKSEKTWVYHIIIDPFDCSTEKVVKFPYTFDGTGVLDLIPYYDTYDIFYTYYTSNITGLPKNPHRYNDQGQRVELDYTLETPPNCYFKFQINTIKPFDASEGYYHSYHQGDEIVLQRLNSRYEKVKEIRLEDTSFEVSTAQGHINYCSIKGENPFCKLLNADLEVQFTSKLSKLNFPSSGWKTGHVDEQQVINLPEKGLVVFTAYEHPSLDDGGINRVYPYDFYLQWVGSDGSVVKTQKIGNASLAHKTDFKIVDIGEDFCHVSISSLFENRDDKVTIYNRCLSL